MWWAIKIFLNYEYIVKFSSEKNEIGEHLANLQAKMLIVSHPCLLPLYNPKTGHACGVLLKMKISPDNVSISHRNCFGTILL